MKSFTALTALATLLSTTSAATVTLKTTDCLQPIALLQFTIDTDKLVAKELKSLCGLELISASGVSLDSLSCQAFKDAEGKEPGSAIFNSTSPALIATNPVQEGSILCKSSEAPNGNGTVSITSIITVLPSGAPPASSGTAIPTPSGNSTVPSVTGGPSVAPSSTTTGAPAPTGAAAQMGLSVGVVAAAFAVLLL
ncbi:hypothetical protein K505DRAFT_326318 [Melanomma pulvis-pyrius CBS 109.77]|uniref:GPI anchored cell wall protein n=1 Tax=Melanomma pulvis-pyrius CBS 109.77 TaxID=1314802 RepID=A0A6A6X790_9PLEO|nr:hypothetical protein K505DRAFT_326318 [Melanomma pulvis-pyrius CBS 109.77]